MPSDTAREIDASRKREKRAAERAIVVPPPADLARRTTLESDPFEWLRFYLAEAFTDPFTDDQREIITDVQRAMREGEYLAIAAPRGDGKTTLVKGLLVMSICTGVIRFAVGIGATARQTEEAILAGVKDELESNDLLLSDYPEICVPIRALEGSPKRAAMQTYQDEKGEKHRTKFQWAGDGVVLPTVEGSRASGTVFRTRGADAAIRGLLFRNRRPDFVIIDDPDTDESAASALQTEKRCKVIRRGISQLGTGRRKLGVVMLTTISALDSVSDIFTDPKREPAWNGRRYRALKAWPVREDLWEEYTTLRRTYDPQEEGAKDRAQIAATAFYRANRAAMDEGAVVSNPYRFDPSRGQLSALQRCFDTIADDGREAFETECQNNPPAEVREEDSGLTDIMVRTRCNGRPRGVVPSDIIRNGLTIGIDVGMYTCHLVAIAWRRQAIGEIVDYEKIDVHNPRELGIEKAIMAALVKYRNELIREPYINDDGEPVVPSFILIDSQYQTDTVIEFCKASGHPFFPTHGYGKGHRGMRAFHAPPKGAMAGDHLYAKVGDTGVREFHIDADHWKTWVHTRFTVEAGKPASLVLFGDEPKDHKVYAEHVVAEKWDALKQCWKKLSKYNHYFDATALACAAGSVVGVSAVPQPVNVNPARAQRPRARVTGGFQPR